MQKSDITPDAIRDAPKGHGEEQSPGPVAVIPGRAIVDTRFARFPTAMLILAKCCGHAKNWTATFYVNQSSIARYMGTSQQAVSQHMNRLVQWGYIEKLRKEDQRRKYGHKGALWRVIYDPQMSFKDVEAWADRQPKTPEQEQEAIEDTIKQVAKGAKGQQSRRKQNAAKEAVDNSAPTSSSLCKEDASYKPQLVRTHKSQLVSNLQHRTIEERVNEVDCRKLCISYSHELMARWQVAFRHDLRQEALARELLGMYKDVDDFIADASKLLDWQRKNNKQPPQSLQYFVTRKQKQDKPIDAQGLINKVVAGTRMP